MSHVLIADDNRMNRLLLARSLEQKGHDITFAENGKQALDLLRAGSFDLVLLDVEMPEMNGYQVLEQVHGDMRLRDIPIIVTSALDEIDSVVKCIELGAEDYLNKPVNPVLLQARVNASLEKKRLRDQQRDVMSKFMTAEVAEDVQAGGFVLGGKLVEATVMFCDIRSFTTITEAQTPAETIELLNDYYTLMMDAIGSEGGIVNQIIGDGLMSVFGAPIPQPDHAMRAVRAAQQMMELIEQFNKEQIARKRFPLRIGIGIASGEMIAGYTGTIRRATYTCVGDTVNLAARLESLTKTFGEPILVDEQAREALDETVPVIEKGETEIRGKTRPVRVFTIALR